MRRIFRGLVVVSVAVAAWGAGTTAAGAGQLCVGATCENMPVQAAGPVEQVVQAAADAVGSVCAAVGHYNIPLTGSGFTLVVCEVDHANYPEPYAPGTFSDTATGLRQDDNHDLTGLVTLSGNYTYGGLACREAGLWIELPAPLDPNIANAFDSPVSLYSWNCV